MAEGALLERVCASKAYRGFESHLLRTKKRNRMVSLFFCLEEVGKFEPAVVGLPGSVATGASRSDEPKGPRRRSRESIPPPLHFIFEAAAIRFVLNFRYDLQFFSKLS